MTGGRFACCSGSALQLIRWLHLVGDVMHCLSDGIHLVAYEEGFAAQMEAAREVMRENRDVLRKLAE